MTSMIFFLIFIPILAFALLALTLLLGPHMPYSQKLGPFECGFSSFRGQNRTEFSISFFLFGLCFLLLDLEILLVYPYAVSIYNNGGYGLVYVIIFLLILTAGFVYEMARGALKIKSQQSGYQ
jgi:NADH-ubiquinone oxidoreductase chain 3|uniref:NADH-ubiquinone oxidoreductase chain 3 n=1 Tax=Pyronema omphalodes TaxID=337075 RepID=A0A140IMV5_9PEZI|nr:NADH-ubiquinone oxidoreductase chain 3 [Pyronema omphalodes]AMO66513.1 NADH-ubiquinone oxidoreductase chain 3 [Pyronema omphalodes]